MKRFVLFLVFFSFAGETYSMSCRGTCKIRVPGGSYEEDVVQDITSPKTWDNKVTVKVAAHDEVRDVTMPTVPDDVKSLAAARPHMDNFCASHFKNYTGLSSVVSCNFPPTAAEAAAQKKADKEWEIEQKKEQIEANKKQKQYDLEQKKLAIEEAAVNKKAAANFKKFIGTLASSEKCAPGEVAITAEKPQMVKLASSHEVEAFQGCAKKNGKNLVLTSGVIQVPEKRVFTQVSKGLMNGTAVGLNAEAGTKLTYANNKIVAGTYTKQEWTNEYNYRGELKEVSVFAGDKQSQKIFHQVDGEDEKSPLFLASQAELKKGKKISQKDFNADGKLATETHWNAKGELFAQTEMTDGRKEFSCTAKPNYQDKKSFYKHCVDEDYYASITKVFSKLEDKYPEMKLVQDKLNTTHTIRFDEKRKCILKSEFKKVVVKLNPDMKYTDPKYNYTVDKTYSYSDEDADEIYTVLTSGKGLREVCGTIATEPRSKSMGAYGKLKKAVYCKEAPAGDEIIIN